MSKKGDTDTLTEDKNNLETEQLANIVKWQPRLITGGKSGGSGNWLADLNEGCIFLVKPKSSGGFALGQFHLLHRFTDAVHLMDNLGAVETHIWVDPISFCSQFSLVRVLYEPEDVDNN
jgi:hypothetical protein